MPEELLHSLEAAWVAGDINHYLLNITDVEIQQQSGRSSTVS